MLGEMFPGPKIRDESGEAGDGQPPFRLGPIDLENNTVVLHRADEPAEPTHPTVDVSTPLDEDARREQVQQG
jgi:hypothetical protein